ncbi:MAG: hypothetical protein ACLQU3_29270 [Limisphaerales bacterium]
MKAKAQEGQERSSRGVIWVWLCWLAVVVMLYVLSAGPLVMMQEKQLIRYNTIEGPVIIAVYFPLSWAYKNTLLHQPLGMYLHLWAPRNFDSKGNLK